MNGGSDHKLLKRTRFSKAQVRSTRYVRKRCFKNFCKDKFCEAVKEISWYADLHNLRNPQDYLGGTSWKTVKLEAHLKKYETEDYENDEILE